VPTLCTVYTIHTVHHEHLFEKYLDHNVCTVCTAHTAHSPHLLTMGYLQFLHYLQYVLTYSQVKGFNFHPQADPQEELPGEGAGSPHQPQHQVRIPREDGVRPGLSSAWQINRRLQQYRTGLCGRAEGFPRVSADRRFPFLLTEDLD
jgi:hypothetical protein